jgi:hypothetical protein
MQEEAKQDRRILNVLCNDFYALILQIVTKYSEKQEEKTLVQGEEFFVRTMQRDLFDSDIFNDFSMLYKDNCKVINIIENMPAYSAEGFRSSMKEIVDFVSLTENKQ